MYFEIEPLDEETSLMKEEAHRFAEEVMRPAAAKLDRVEPGEVVENDSPFWHVVKEMKKLGYHKMWVPREEGGVLASGKQLAVILEELGWGSVGLTSVLGVDLAGFTTVVDIGSEELKEELTEPWKNDEKAEYLGCWPITEAEHGSDAILAPFHPNPEELGRRGGITAREERDEWILNGSTSQWVSSGPVATHALVTYVTPPDAKSLLEGGTCIVPLDLEGVTKGRPIDKIGMREDPQGEIVFQDVRVSKRYVLAEQPLASLLRRVLVCSMFCFMAAASTGLARAAFEEALRYSKQRVQGGKPICEHESVKVKLYQMFEKIETARRYARGVLEHMWERVLDPSYRHASVAQIYCSRVAYEVAHDAVQIHGGYGLTKEFLVQKLYRDARVLLIEDGPIDALSIGAAHDIIENY